MSRIGKKPISIPNGVEVSARDNVIVFKKGNVTKELDTKGNVKFSIKDGELTFASAGEDRQSAAYWGTYRALANNVIIGLTSGFEKKLEINGVGYRLSGGGQEIEMALGFSHPVKYKAPEGVQLATNKMEITVSGIDKQKVGQVAAEIRSLKKPEPYKGKGIKYVDEVILRKAGKAGK